MKVNGAEVLVSLMEEAGIDVVAGIPGHTVGDFALAVGRSLKIRSLLVRHEATATFAADVHYRVSGRLMGAFTHAFPGAANGLVGVANAYADYSSMFYVSGDTASVGMGRGGYQELSRQINDDVGQLIRPAVKRLWEPRSAGDMASNAMAALREATSGRPGPVSLNVSQEVWSQEIEVAAMPSLRGFSFESRTRPDSDAVERAVELLLSAERPVILAGNGVNLGRARQQLRLLAETYELPVATTASGKGAFPEDHALALGVAGWTGSGLANEAMRSADIVLVLGARLAETTASSWTPGATFDIAKTRLIQADVELTAIANAYPVEEALLGDMALVLEDLLSAMSGRSTRNLDKWRSHLEDARAAWTKNASVVPGTRGAIGTGLVTQSLRNAFDGPINLVSDCGKHHKWIVQQFEAREDDYVISSMGGASMGIGLAGAIGATLARPEASTIAWLGDGGMSMSLAALPTVAEYRLPIITVVIDDASYGVVANAQMAQAGRTAFSVFDGSGENPDYRLDFSAVAEGCGIVARTVEDPASLDDAFAWARSQEGPSLLTIKSDRSSSHPSGGGELHPLADNSRQLTWARS